MTDPVAREFLLAFWKLHILHHAGRGGVYGQWMLEELAEHGYRLSPGTLYPMLARMERHGWIRSTVPARATAARRYTLTAAGRSTLARLRAALDELHAEVGTAGRAKATGPKLKDGAPKAAGRAPHPGPPHHSHSRPSRRARPRSNRMLQ